MKKALVLSFLISLIVMDIQAQKMAGMDKSPMDMAYYPNN